MAIPVLDATTRPYLCHRSESAVSAIEKCLDNGTDACFVVDDDRRLLGRVTLDDIRGAIRDGRFGAGATVEALMNGHSDAPGRGRSDPAADGILTAVLDRSGRIAEVRLDRGKAFIQVAKPHLSHGEFRALLDAFLSTWISGKGAHIDEFEAAFAAAAGARYGIAVANGTVALHLALVALGIGPGDEVIVPDLTFAATINAVLYCGATPVVADIDRRSWTLSADIVARAITARTRAIVPVHLYGRPAEIGPIAALAQERGIAIVEDCAEAHGARYAGKPVGSFSDIACFSFHANKLLATGEGGMCVTSDAALCRKAKELRDHGMAPERCYWHEQVGYNYRLPNLQAAIGRAQLSRLEQTVERNRALEHAYRGYFRGIPDVGFPPPLPADYEPVVWLVCVQVPAAARAEIIEAASGSGIELRPFFYPLSAMPPYRRFARACPVSAAVSAAGLNLPTSHAVDSPAIEKIARVFRSVLA